MARQRKSGAAELTAAAPEPDELVADFPLEGAAAAATTPGGMVRIGKGGQQRCIWPVHLAGWQHLGWTVLGAQGAEPQTAEPQSAEPRTAGRRSARPEPPIEPTIELHSAIDPRDPLEPLNPPLDPAPDLDPLAWDDTTSEQP